MTLEENALKEKLTRIKKNGYLTEKEDSCMDLGLKMLDNIGSTDSELRDKLIYDIFFHWIMDGRFAVEQLEELLNICLGGSHLFYKLRDEDEDAVYKRTFSALIIALIIYQNGKGNFLSEKTLQETKDRLVEYMIQEKDVRGYVEGKGWAHSAAHTADALDEVVQCSCIDKGGLMDVLNAIRAKACIGYYVYVDEESERMVTAVVSAFNRKVLEDSEIVEWLQGFSIEDSKGSHMEKFHSKVNRKGFLRSLYFRLLDQEDSSLVVEETIKVLRKIEE